MNLVPHRNKLGALVRFAQLFLSTSGHQAATRKHLKQNEKIIRRYDKTFKRSEITRTRLSNGFIFDKDVLRFKDREYLIDVFKRYSPDCTEIVNYYVPLIDGSMAKIIQSIIDLYLQDMKVYLGPSLRLDNYYFHATTPVSSSSVSSSWHTDNVGHRIKMFITLQSDGKIPTAYIPGSNRKLFRMPVVEQLRFFGILDYRKKRGEKLIRHESGSVALLDTNGLHRGVYEASPFQRLCFVIEFIDREKADGLVDRGLPVGPGRIVRGCDPTRFTDEAVAMLSGVLDKRLLHNMGDGIQVYDLKGPSQEDFAQAKDL
jgi:hypothetical protein